MATPSDAHLLAFGRIIHNFASVETGIKLILSGILDAHIDAAFIAFQPYSATDLRNVAKSVAKERLKPELAEQFCCIVGDWFASNGLRNVIAHSRWTDGARPDGIKPRRLSIREGRADWIGEDLQERDYTAADLEREAEKLNAINERCKKFLQTSGLRDVIAKYIDADREAMSVSSGSPTSSPSR
jgi:hypothetical protein